MQKPNYRDDINGLRAISVIAVLLFHFKMPGATGGFAGVDVFFVISGYLMTEIILSRQEQARFSLWQFWIARARRIVPALVFIVLCVLIFGFFWIDALVFEQIGKEALQALLFISNIVFWRSVGYFDARADEKWFLHTWSLGVEWQFYILFPLAMIALHSLIPDLKKKFLIFLGFTFVSFVVGILYRHISHASAFYLLPFRSWELLAGGLVAFIPRLVVLQPRMRSTLVVAGLIAILASIVLFDRMTAWPSLATLLPVSGAVAVILANRSDARWAANPVLRPIGHWSYSIYLWHWPFIVGWIYLELPHALMLPVFVACFAIGAIGLTWIVANLALINRHGSRGAVMTAIWVLVCFSALAVFQFRGVPSRHPSEVRFVEALRIASQDWGFPPNCNGLQKDGTPKVCGFNMDMPGRAVAFLGDSHSSLWYSRFLGREGDTALGPVFFLTAAACPPIVGVGRAEQYVRCDGFYESAIRHVKEKAPRRLVISSIWTTYARFGGNDTICFFAPDGTCATPESEEKFQAQLKAAFDRSVPIMRQLRERGTEIVVVLPLPIHKRDIPKTLARLDFQGRSLAPVSSIEHRKFVMYNEYVLRLLREFAGDIGANIVDPSEALCKEGRCATIGHDGVPFYMDSNHLTSRAMKLDRFRFVDGFVAP